MEVKRGSPHQHAQMVDDFGDEGSSAVYNDFNPTPPAMERRQQKHIKELEEDLEFGDVDDINNDLKQ